MAEGVAVGLAVGGLVLVALLTLALLQRFGGAAGRQSSPAPWIADAVWGLVPQGAMRLMPVGGVMEPEVVAVSDDDRRRVPRADVARGVELPPAGSPTQQRDRLLATPGPTRIRMPVWPLCCERLAVLVALRPTPTALEALERAAGPLDQAFLEREVASWGGPGADRAGLMRKGWGDVLAGIRGGAHDGEGIAVYHCYGCGRMYVASCGPTQ